MRQKKFCIVGQGLAGTLLAHSLLEREQSVTIIDNSWKNAASVVAAGMWNPLNFRTMGFSWMAPILVPFLIKRIKQLESKLSVKLLYDKDIVKKIPDNHSAELLENKREEIKDFLVEGQHAETNNLNLPYGSFTISKTGVLDISTLIAVSRDYFKSKGIYQSEKFSWDQVQEDLCYISCEGFQSKYNPYFQYIPMPGNKGEILLLDDHPDWSGSDILNCSKFLFRGPEGQLKAGSTYKWNNTNLDLTTEAVDEILKPFKSTLKAPISVSKQIVGIRPTTLDRRPLLGRHPERENIAIFGGLGTKGVMLGPYFSEQMAEFLVNDQPLNPEVDINRFIKRYHD